MEALFARFGDKPHEAYANFIAANAQSYDTLMEYSSALRTWLRRCCPKLDDSNASQLLKLQFFQGIERDENLQAHIAPKGMDDSISFHSLVGHTMRHQRNKSKLVNPIKKTVLGKINGKGKGKGKGHKELKISKKVVKVNAMSVENQTTVLANVLY
jgi:dsDNA-binding SOS-regulon protein